MAYAVTHVLVPIIILDVLRHYVFGLKKFPRYLIVVGGIAGLLPDIDIILGWIYNWFIPANVDVHGMFSHSLFFPIVFIFIAIYFEYIHNTKWRNILYVTAFGWFMHILLDWLYGEYKAIFWPFLTADPTLFPSWNLWIYSAHIDAIILVLWLVHEELHGYVKDYF